MLYQKEEAEKETTLSLDAIAQAFTEIAVAFLDEQALGLGDTNAGQILADENNYNE